MKLLIFTLGLLVTAVTSQCPEPPQRLRTCVFTDENCLHDSECLNGQICCPHLCGKICKDKIVSKPGKCPPKPVFCLSRVSDPCSVDNECPGDEKCCDLCGKTCSTGKCPPKPVFCLSRVSDPCSVDNECPGDEKCCDLCGKTCSTVCPVVDCLPGTLCKFGFKLDRNGCQTCECKTTPCENEAPLTVDNNGDIIDCGRPSSKCPTNSHCKIGQGVAVCCPKVHCPPVRAIFCKFGNVPDENDCPTCQCKKTPCENEAPLTVDNNGDIINCGPGSNSCPPNSECKNPFSVCCPQVCAKPACENFCIFGNVVDDNGCKTCTCKKTPCYNEAPITVDNNGKEIGCGRGSDGCPQNSACKTNPAHRFAVCCPKGHIIFPTPFEKPGECPKLTLPLPRCLTFPVSCDDDSTCPGSEKCCEVPCGIRCVNRVTTGGCLKPVCERFCIFGNIVDDNGCKTCKCKKTPCYNEAPITVDNNGEEIGCGRGSDECPQNSACKTDPAYRFAVCCPKDEQMHLL